MKFTKDHEWISLETSNVGVVGISNHAQEALGDITFVEVPAVGTVFKAGDVFGVVESVKAASEIYMPLAGKVIAVNEQLENFPQLLNSDPEGLGWILKLELENPSEIESLMTKDEYLASL